jgi:hypothetical protein
VVIAGRPAGIHRAPAQRLARQELARGMYQRPIWDRVLDAFQRWLSSLTGRAVHIPGPVALTVLVLVLVAVVAAVAWLGPARRSRRQAAAVLSGASLSAADYRRNAERLAARGDFSEAIAERVRAIAVDLERRAVLPPRPGRTAAELADETAAALPAGALPGGEDRLHDAARLFDDVRYGGRDGTQDGYARVRDLDADLMSVRTASAAAGGTALAGAVAGQAARPV